MNSASTFQIYNASAGSGKTFTLVKEYLKILLTNEDIFTFQRVLAITFTNKAAGEMKERVLINLKEFSEGIENTYFHQILQETNLDSEILKDRSKKIVFAILQNYAAFYITTIDSFTYKIIKSFAYDLGLTQNFEVEMDADELLNLAVERLVSKIGINDELTEVLIQYSLDKTEDDKSWDISRELVEFSKILLNENDAKHFKKLTSKSLDSFKKLQKKLIADKKQTIDNLKSIGVSGLEIINYVNLEFNDFYRSMLPNHFFALSKDPETAKFFDNSNLKLRIEERNFYAKSKSEDVKATIEGIIPELIGYYEKSEKEYQKLVLTNLILKNIIPLSVLNHINKELEEIKEESNVRLNAEFNQLISENIQDQPAPFIYERIGQKFQHYFIDEMQDTSVLQWKNLIPLIDNSLSQENTSLLLVGDGKQAIYRWRGGKAEQFIDLSKNEEASFNPFQIEKQQKQLTTNYRSYSAVVDFNNSFFKHCSKFIEYPDYQELFSEKSFQEKSKKEKGFVSLTFLDKVEDKQKNKEKYAQQVFDTIKDLEGNYSLGDICIIVRKKREGVDIANFLSENGIAIVSSETLLLNNSSRVQFIIHFLSYIQNPEDRESLYEVLSFLYDHSKIEKDKHYFLEQLIVSDFYEVLENLKDYNFTFDFSNFQELPLYEKVEFIVSTFQLNKSSDAYVQFFLDEVLDQQKKQMSVQDFLDYWKLKKEKLSVVSSENTNAVSIMTIHKSKGLEFPIVIFPCDLDIYGEINPMTWIHDLPTDQFEGFSEFMISSRKELQYVGDRGNQLYKRKRQELELDNFNLLYVALTRAQQQLHIITEKKMVKGQEKQHYYSGIFINYLKSIEVWSEEQNQYSFGEKGSFKTEIIEQGNQVKLESLQTNSWKNQNIQLLANSSKHWGTERGKAIDYGDLVHEMMSHIITKNDIESVIEKFLLKGAISLNQVEKVKKLLLRIVDHPVLEKYYSNQFRIYNERELIDNSDVVIPDRLAVKDSRVVVIDYKTGNHSDEHLQQLFNYQRVIEDMGYSVEKKILIYIGDSISIEEF